MCRQDTQLLADFLSEYPRGHASEFERWVRRYPEQETALRRTYEAWKEAAQVLGELRDQQADGTDRGQKAGFAAGRILGDFQLVRRLGHGGQGSVWEAEQRSLGRRVALKLLPPERVDERTAELLRREARASGMVNHSGIVAVYGRGETEGVHWIAQELVPGGRTLRTVIDEARDRPELAHDYYRSATVLIKSVAEAVQVAHDAGIIHRDIKPLNILIAPNGEPKVADFGLARLTHEEGLSVSGDVIGTYYYMSPEQVEGQRSRLDARTDVFSLGAVFYELLALQRPFNGDTTTQIAQKILREDPPDLSRMRSRIPRDLIVICNKAMEKDRARRYSSMAELASDLRRHLNDEPISARAPSIARLAQKWMVRHPSKSIAVLASSVVVGALGWGLGQFVLARERGTQLSAFNTRIIAAANIAVLSEELSRIPPFPDAIPELESWLWSARAAVGMAQSGELDGSDNDPAHDFSRLSVYVEEACQEVTHPTNGLVGSGISREHGWGAQRKLDMARSIAALQDETARMWDEIGRLPFNGLVPLGKSRMSGLWEFWHVPSGERPLRDVDGRYAVGPGTGMVFVLIPGGRFVRGSTRDEIAEINRDAKSRLRREDPTFDEEQHEVDVESFLISKYELTQSQWLALSGWHTNVPFSPILPVTELSWFEVEETLRRFSLRLPSEDQWEYAARAGADGAWTVPSSEICQIANLLDRAHREDVPGPMFGDPAPCCDGHVAAAPVGSLIGNEFGLYDMIGNVWEWSRDDYGAELEPEPFPEGVPPRSKTIRGGSWQDSMFFARVAERQPSPPRTRNGHAGARAVIELGDGGWRD